MRKLDGVDPRTTDDESSDQEIECTGSKPDEVKSDSTTDEGEDPKSE